MDDLNGRLIAVGGQGYHELLEETELIDLAGSGWSALPPGGPSPRRAAALVGIPTTGSVLLIGGQGYYEIHADVWRLE